MSGGIAPGASSAPKPVNTTRGRTPGAVEREFGVSVHSGKQTSDLQHSRKSLAARMPLVPDVSSLALAFDVLPKLCLDGGGPSLNGRLDVLA